MPGLVPNPSPFWNPDVARQNSLASMLRGNSVALSNQAQNNPLPQFDWASKANTQNQANQQASLNSLMFQPTASGGFSPSEMTDIQQNVQQSMGGGTLNALLRALGAQESGNRYGAKNSSSGAMGRWQVMPSNITGPGGWDMEALRRNISPQQFMSQRGLQDAIVRYKFGNYLKKYGRKGALSAWYSGDPNRWKSGGGGNPSVYDYVMQVLNRL